MKILNELQGSLQVAGLEHGLKLRIEGQVKERGATSKVPKLALPSQTQRNINQEAFQWTVKTNSCFSVFPRKQQKNDISKPCY